MTIAEYRRAIDAVDDEIAAALSRRFALTDEVRELRRREQLGRIDEVRERAIYERMMAAVPVAHRDTMFSIYERILNGSRGMVETIARGVAIRGDKVLLCRAKGGASTYLPGGHIEFGETAAAALVREIREELGVEARCGQLLGVVENAFVQHGKPHSEINLVYALEIPEGVAEPPTAQEAWIEFEWRNLGDLESANLLPTAMLGLLSRR